MREVRDSLTPGTTVYRAELDGEPHPRGAGVEVRETGEGAVTVEVGPYGPPAGVTHRQYSNAKDAHKAAWFRAAEIEREATSS